MSIVDPVTFDGVSAREEAIVVDVLDGSRNVIGQVKPSTKDAARLAVNGLGRFTRTLTGVTLDTADSAALNAASDRLRPSWVIDGTSYPLGVFLIGDDRRFLSTRPLTTEKGWVDEQQIVAQSTETTLALGAGTVIAATLVAILEALLPDVQVDASSAVLTQSVAWPAGTDRGQIIASLCASAGFLPPFTDNQGTYRCVTAPDLDTVPVDFTYQQGSVIVDQSRTEADAWLDTPNRYVVINTGATAGSVVGVFDVPAAAPYSVAARGFAVTEVIEQQGVLDFMAAAQAARAAYVAASSQFTTGYFDTPMIPTHDVWNVVQVGASDLWLEVGWTVALRAGAVQQHQLRRIYR